jgi:hypothetical protein
MLAHFGNPVWITNQNYCPGNFFRTHIQVINGATAIDNKFGVRYFGHGLVWSKYFLNGKIFSKLQIYTFDEWLKQRLRYD